MINTCSMSLYLGVMNVFGGMDRGKWTLLGKYVTMEVGYGFITVIVFVVVIGTPHGDPLISGFVGLQWEEAILLL